MSFFDGMYLHEIILLIGGGVLFVALVISLLRQVLTNRPFKALLPFFLVSILMMGFPAVSSVKVGNGVVEIDKTTHALEANPHDASLRAQLQTEVNKLTGRTFKSAQATTTLAQAQFALGHENEAKRELAHSLAVDPNYAPAQDLKAKIEVASNLTRLTAAAGNQPDNPQVRQELQNTVSAASKYRFANPQTVETMKKATTMLQAQPTAAGHMHPGMLPVETIHTAANH